MSGTNGSFNPSTVGTSNTDLTQVETSLADLIVAVQASDQDDDGQALADLLAAVQAADQDDDAAGLALIAARIQSHIDQDLVEDDETQTALATANTALAALVADLADEEPRSLDVTYGHELVAAGATWNPPAGNLQAVQWAGVTAVAVASVTAGGVTVAYPAGLFGASLVRNTDLRLVGITAIEAIGGDVLVTWTIE